MGAMRARDSEAGLTMIELMVSMGLAAIAAGFAFSIYGRMSDAARVQSRVSELQQTLRTASDLIVRDVRLAGYMTAEAFRTAVAPTADLKAFGVENNADGFGSDLVRVVYADTSASAKITKGPPANPFNSAVSKVESVSSFSEGELIFAVRTSNPGRGQGCAMKITKIIDGPNPMIQHNPGEGAPWNEPGNDQCSNLCGDGTNTCWDDGQTEFARFTAHAYRIHPTDPRGLLEMSPTGDLAASTGLVDDWVTLGEGFVDMQLALRVFQQSDTVDEDGDGDPERDWFSGENMETVLDTGARPISLRLNLVGRTTGRVEGIFRTKVQDFYDKQRPDNNSLGDHVGVTLSGTSIEGSRYTRESLYRWSSTIVDFRNMGAGL